MTSTGLFVAAAAVIILLVYIAWTSRRCARESTADAQPGRGLIDESVTAIKNVADQVISTVPCPRDRR